MRPWYLSGLASVSAANPSRAWPPLSFPPRCAVASGRIRTPPPWQAIDGSRPRSVKPWIEPPRLSLTLHPLVEDVGSTGQRPGESVYLVTTKVSPARQATEASRRRIGPPLASRPSTCAHAARLRLSSPPSDVPQAGPPTDRRPRFATSADLARVAGRSLLLLALPWQYFAACIRTSSNSSPRTRSSRSRPWSSLSSDGTYRRPVGSSRCRASDPFDEPTFRLGQPQLLRKELA
jgi:hypothetical protein